MYGDFDDELYRNRDGVDDSEFDDGFDDVDDLLEQEDDFESRYYDDFDENDGQPDEYTEWQDYMGGDDWDHGQYDAFGGEG